MKTYTFLEAPESGFMEVLWFQVGGAPTPSTKGWREPPRFYGEPWLKVETHDVECSGFDGRRILWILCHVSMSGYRQTNMPSSCIFFREFFFMLKNIILRALGGCVHPDVVVLLGSGEPLFWRVRASRPLALARRPAGAGACRWVRRRPPGHQGVLGGPAGDDRGSALQLPAVRHLVPEAAPAGYACAVEWNRHQPLFSPWTSRRLSTL